MRQIAKIIEFHTNYLANIWSAGVLGLFKYICSYGQFLSKTIQGEYQHFTVVATMLIGTP